jgi:hypothetical protein
VSSVESRAAKAAEVRFAVGLVADDYATAFRSQGGRALGGRILVLV